MKKVLLLSILLITGIINAQETEFTFDNVKGMTDFIVTPVEGKSAPEIYKKIIEWIKITYKNPDKVILSTIENEYIRFEGSSENLFALNIVMMGKKYYATKYEIEISIKDGKYKFDIISMQNYYPATQTTVGAWSPNILFNSNLSKENAEALFKKDGSLKNMWKYIPEVPTYFNDLNKSLLLSIVATSTVKKSDW